MWLPTGFGKSLCFQALPFVFDCKRSLVSADVESRSAVIVVAPLVALMVEQVQRLREKGINAVIISSGGREGRVPGDLQATESTFASASFIFSSPEAAAQNKWRDLLVKQSVSSRVCAVVVDEAHCISKWYVTDTSFILVITVHYYYYRSKDFREDYSRLAELRALVPPHFMACTATATKSDKKEVIENLEMGGCVEVSVLPDRPNIFYDRTDLETDLHHLLVTLQVT